MWLSLALLFLIIFCETAFAQEHDAGYYYQIGEGLLRNRSCEEALDSFKTSIAENPMYWDAWYGKGLAHYCLEEYQDGIDLCDQVLGNPQSSQGADLDRFLVLDGDFHKAYEDKYHQYPIEDSQSGLCSGEIPDNYQIAMERYEEALRLNPNSTLAWNSKGIALGSICKIDESIKCFDEALKIDPTLAEVWNNKGVSLDLNGKNNESMYCYNKAIEHNPKLAITWINRASTLSLNLSLSSLARENASQAIELDPSLENDIFMLPNWKYILP
jgi:tetratricopeptide (TPR) repeat protein